MLPFVACSLDPLSVNAPRCSSGAGVSARKDFFLNPTAGDVRESILGAVDEPPGVQWET